MPHIVRAFPTAVIHRVIIRPSNHCLYLIFGPPALLIPLISSPAPPPLLVILPFIPSSIPLPGEGRRMMSHGRPHPRTSSHERRMEPRWRRTGWEGMSHPRWRTSTPECRKPSIAGMRHSRRSSEPEGGHTTHSRGMRSSGSEGVAYWMSEKRIRRRTSSSPSSSIWFPCWSLLKYSRYHPSINYIDKLINQTIQVKALHDDL